MKAHPFGTTAEYYRRREFVLGRRPSIPRDHFDAAQWISDELGGRNRARLWLRGVLAVLDAAAKTGGRRGIR